MSQGQRPQSRHDVPHHVGRAGQVVVGQVQHPQAGHVGEGGGGDEGEFVGGHVEVDDVGKIKPR